MNPTLRRFRELCLSLPETGEVFVDNWGHPTFRVGGQKMFASCSPYDSDQPSFGLKVEKAHQQALVNSDPRYTVSPYVGKHGWITIQGSGVLEWDELRELIEESYILNAPKRLAKLVAG